MGVVYEPDVLDAHDEFARADDIEKACWGFTKTLQGNTTITKVALEVLESVVKAVKSGEELQIDVTGLTELVEKSSEGGLGYQHALWQPDIGEIVENYIAPCDMELEGMSVKKGTWLMGVVWSPEYYQKVQNGDISGYSMGGTGQRIAGAAVEGGEN